MNKVYVFPHFQRKEKEIKTIKGISRLFAFPSIPHFENEGDIIILDSGAYGLSRQGLNINHSHMEKLNEHYNKFGNNNDNVLCIAPDVYLDPFKSIKNIKKWFGNGFYKNITAVIQCDKEKIFDLESCKYQADFYTSLGIEKFCFSNNALTGELAKNLNVYKLFEYLKEKSGAKWIHILGAGWSLDDINTWCNIPYFDSLDSIAYYNVRYIESFGSFDSIKNIHRILEVVNSVSKLRNYC